MPAISVHEETVRLIRAMDEEFVRNVSSGNAEALVSEFYAEDAELLPPNASLIQSRGAILEFWKGMLSAGLKVGRLEANRIEESGEIACASGVYELTLSPPGGGTIADNGKYVVVYRRQSDGGWKAVADIFNSSLPAQAPGAPLESSIRDAYAAFGRGDVDGYLGLCAPDFSFNVPGRGAIAGAWRGKEGMYDLARKAFETTAGTFREDVEAVLVSNSYAVVLARHRFTRDARRMDYRTAHVYEIRGGKLAVCWEQPRDPAAFDDAWGLPGDIAAAVSEHR